jgi:citrate lyase alpha subunit
VLDSKKSLLNHNTPSNIGIVLFVWTYFMAKGMDHTFHLSFKKAFFVLIKIVAIVNIFGFIVYMIAIMLVSCVQPKRKNLVNKIKDGNPSIISTRQMRTQVDATQRKNKSKQSTKIR